MQTLTQTFPIKPMQSARQDTRTAGDSSAEKPIILLDIETTGLSPEMSTVFMIGCARLESDRLSLIQWLADSLELQGEREVLNAFTQWLGECLQHMPDLRLVTYNGHTFDLPFLKTRYVQCGLECPLTVLEESALPMSGSIQATDLYRELFPLKSLWPVPNMKLKTMSRWLDYSYSNAPEGRRLIKAYHEYIKTKDSDILNLLFLHNTDDLRALHTLLPLYNYLLLFRGAARITSAHIQNSVLRICLKPEVFLPRPLSYEAFENRLSITLAEVLLETRIYPQGLRYYYTDIKNYVYLPEEDYVLHKSMAAFIDKSHWQKARRENCYTWFSPDDNFLNDEKCQKEYVHMLFRLFGFLR